MDIGKALKNEIARIAQREAKKMAAAPNKKAAELRHLVASLRRRCDRLEKAVKANTAVVAQSENANEKADTRTDKAPKAWFTGAGVRSLRKKLRLSQAEMGRLCGVTQNCICLWEAKKSKLPLRNATREALTRARGMSMTQAKQALTEK
jgi:DNA-binding transcriptional regulator YiaG